MLSNTLPISSIVSMDCNQLYGYCLTQPMPICDFSFYKAHTHMDNSCTTPSQLTHESESKVRRSKMNEAYPLDATILRISGQSMTGANKGFSSREIEWIEWTQIEYNRLGLCNKHRPLHVGNCGNQIRLTAEPVGGGFRGILVDGFCPTCKTIFEFNGCFWHIHSCNPLCQGQEYYEQNLKRTGWVKEATKHRELLRQLSFKVVTEWECEWESQKWANNNGEGDFYRDMFSGAGHKSK